MKNGGVSVMINKW